VFDFTWSDSHPAVTSTRSPTFSHIDFLLASTFCLWIVFQEFRPIYQYMYMYMLRDLVLVKFISLEMTESETQFDILEPVNDNSTLKYTLGILLHISADDHSQNAKVLDDLRK
jgi:hypothetical protein